MRQPPRPALGTARVLFRSETHDAMIKKVSSIGDDLSKSKPALNQTVKALFAAAARHK